MSEPFSLLNDQLPLSESAALHAGIHFLLQMGQFGAQELHYTLIFFFSPMMLLYYKKDVVSSLMVFLI